MSEMQTTLDRFLNGKLMIRQPVDGYRAATDPVFLAASVPARSGDAVLELGCGVGVASLCLGTRVGGVALMGLELQTEYAELARQNGEINETPFNVIEGDLRQMPAELRALSFDHVMANPPYFGASTGSAPDDMGKAVAHMDSIGMAEWVQAGLRRVKPRGTLTIIQKVEQLPAILSAAGAGGIKVLPIAARQGQPAKRVIVQVQKGARFGFQLLNPFVVHSGSVHVQGQSDYSDRAREILRSGALLPLD